MLTTKHHDGVSLADTKHTQLNVVERTPAGRDLLAPYCEALREEGLKVGFYFTNTDWSNVDNMRVILDKSEEEVLALRKEAVNYHAMYTEMCKLGKNEGTQKPEELEACWARFMEQYRMGIRKLMTKYGNIDAMWFDVMLTRKDFSWEADKVREMIRELNSDTMVNARLVGQDDYETPELYIPLRPLKEHWELCTTFNNSWGYKPQDIQYKDIHGSASGVLWRSRKGFVHVGDSEFRRVFGRRGFRVWDWQHGSVLWVDGDNPDLGGNGSICVSDMLPLCRKMGRIPQKTGKKQVLSVYISYRNEAGKTRRFAPKTQIQRHGLH